MPRFLLTAILVCLTLCCLPTATAQRRNTISRPLKAITTEKGRTDIDTLRADSSTIRFAGYDKKLRSNRETVFATNLGTGSIFRMIFRMEYFDTQGRLLHKRRVMVNTDIPPGETRCIDFPTWDRQGSFYYQGSQRPRIPGVPYNVKIQPDTIITTRPDASH